MVMSYKIRLLPIAQKDLQAAKGYFNDIKENLGEEFKLEVNKEIDYIGEFPLHYQPKYKEIRQALVRRFPYSIFYLIEEEKKEILIVGVLHAKQNPDTVMKRNK
jgi:toxin ParE1/3/4